MTAVWVSLKRMCENIGLAYSRQRKKLSGKGWAVMTQRVSTGSDGKRYEMAMLNLDSVPMWLATVDKELRPGGQDTGHSSWRPLSHIQRQM